MDEPSVPPRTGIVTVGRTVTVEPMTAATSPPSVTCSGGMRVYAGERMSAYLAWHPLDHITWELARPAPSGGADEGASYRIVEAFGRDERFRVDSVERVEKLDETGIRLVRRIAGMRVAYIHSHITIVHASNATTGLRISAPIMPPPFRERGSGTARAPRARSARCSKR